MKIPEKNMSRRLFLKGSLLSGLATAGLIAFGKNPDAKAASAYAKNAIYEGETPSLGLPEKLYVLNPFIYTDGSNSSELTKKYKGIHKAAATVTSAWLFRKGPITGFRKCKGLKAARDQFRRNVKAALKKAGATAEEIQEQGKKDPKFEEIWIRASVADLLIQTGARSTNLRSRVVVNKIVKSIGRLITATKKV